MGAPWLGVISIETVVQAGAGVLEAGRRWLGTPGTKRSNLSTIITLSYKISYLAPNVWIGERDYSLFKEPVQFFS